MPKVVDHEQRRREIGEAVLRVVLRGGVGGASVRSVAAEAGWSTGALRYYFGTQDELREFVANLASERVRSRIESYLEQVDPDTPLLERSANMTEHLLPLDEDRRQEYQLWLAVTDWSRQSGRDDTARLWDEQRQLYRQIAYRLSGHPDEPMPPPSETHPGVEAWAEYLHVFVDGLATQAMFLPDEMSPDRARAVLRAFLAEIPRLAANA